MIDDEFKKDAEESRIARWGFAAINACLRIRFRIGDAVTVAKGRLALLAHIITGRFGNGKNP
ncbi:MAG TPA: hypothetical protein PK587_04195 [Syntrophales bacterium]|nr:hypothetical protein [Syntrophales bacterium]